MRTTTLLLSLALVTAACGGGEPIGGRQIDEVTASSAVLDLATLPLADWGCGYAFTVGTDDQTVRLTLSASSEAPPEPGTVELGDGVWEGQLVLGENLFAQWCDDVVEPDEPEVVEESVLPVTGTLTWEAAGTGTCDGAATGTLTDASVTAGGQVLPLPDLDLRNEFFGCFAG